MHHHHSSYGTQTFRREIAQGRSPLECSRARVLLRTIPAPTGNAGVSRPRQRRWSRQALVNTAHSAELRHFFSHSRADRHARSYSLRSGHGGVAVSNTDGRRFDSFRACPGPDRQSGHPDLDNCRGIVIGTSATCSRDGSVVRFPPDPPCASERAPCRRSSASW
jgi:hypothetical protein